uniref:ATP synthase F0 subunit 8 n=1 Tax=Leptopilina syphax TaxID=2755057 RepID=A0A7D6JNS4_9HYME|nr:ATP synthase F0 subunit 8 [Leptopilina syphax]
MPQMKPMYWLLLMMYLWILWIYYMILMSGFFLKIYLTKIKKYEVLESKWDIKW